MDQSAEKEKDVTKKDDKVKEKEKKKSVRTAGIILIDLNLETMDLQN